MSIFDSIEAKKIVSEKEEIYQKKKFADKRIAEYYQIKFKMYMEFFKGFSSFAINEKLPIKTYKSTEVFVKKLIGWRISPSICISQDGECYLVLDESLDHQRINYKKCEMAKAATEAADIAGGKMRLECYYDTIKEVIHIQGGAGDNEFELDIPDEEYYVKIDEIIREKLKKYCENVVHYILSS